MLDREKVRAELRPLLVDLATKQAKKITVNLVEDLSSACYHLFDNVKSKVYDGTVCIITDDVLVISAKRNTFDVIDKALMESIPEVGDKVELTPYVRHQFDGQPMGEPIKVATQYMDGLFLNENSCILGENIVHIPGEKVRNRQLRDLVCYLQELELSDNYRNITHLMVDVGANNFSVVDPADEYTEELPSLKFSVNSTKFVGDVHIVYHYSSDSFSIAFYDSDVQIFENLDFSDIGPTLENHLDDGLWKYIKVKVLTKAKRKS